MQGELGLEMGKEANSNGMDWIKSYGWDWQMIAFPPSHPHFKAPVPIKLLLPTIINWRMVGNKMGNGLWC
jgi:hypothetical protein